MQSLTQKPRFEFTSNYKSQGTWTHKNLFGQCAGTIVFFGGDALV